MSRSSLVDVEAVRAKLATRFRNQRRDWFNGGGSWPLSIPLGAPTEAEVMGQVNAARAWAAQWQAWLGPGAVAVESRRWGQMGRNDVPVSISFMGPADVAAFIGEGARWETAAARRGEIARQWPQAEPSLSRCFDELADYSAVDWERLLCLLKWLVEHPTSNLYPRQLPVRGMHSKWLEERQGLLQTLLAAISGRAGTVYEQWGLRRPPALCRLLVLDPTLRAATAGLRDVQAPLAEIAQMEWAPRRVLILENLQSGLGLPDIDGAVAIVRLGYAVDSIGSVSWITPARCVYWGDLDSHGFAILARARKHLPGLGSALMDVRTFEDHRDLAVHDDDGCGAPDRSLLTGAEREAFDALVAGVWGAGARLEQERIGWEYAADRVLSAFGEG